MTWLSDKSGMASIGVAVSAHQPQPASARYNATTMKRFFSDSSMSRLIMSHDTRHGRARARRYSPGTAPGQTHDDGEWLTRGTRRAGGAFGRALAVRASPRVRGAEPSEADS